jgi:hypothetical protein
MCMSANTIDISEGGVNMIMWKTATPKMERKNTTYHKGTHYSLWKDKKIKIYLKQARSVSRTVASSLVLWMCISHCRLIQANIVVFLVLNNFRKIWH